MKDLKQLTKVSNSNLLDDTTTVNSYYSTAQLYSGRCRLYIVMRKPISQNYQPERYDSMFQELNTKEKTQASAANTRRVFFVHTFGNDILN